MRRNWQMMALLAAATIAVFWRVGRHEFVNYDDPAYVTLNPMVQAGFTWPGVKWAFGELHGEATYWHPITWLSHMLDCQLFGLRPAGHHLTNLTLHVFNTLLLFALLRRLTGDASRVTSDGWRVASRKGTASAASPPRHSPLATRQILLAQLHGSRALRVASAASGYGGVDRGAQEPAEHVVWAAGAVGVRALRGSP
jgi:hypothetical protein